MVLLSLAYFKLDLFLIINHNSSMSPSELLNLKVVRQPPEPAETKVQR